MWALRIFFNHVAACVRITVSLSHAHTFFFARNIKKINVVVKFYSTYSKILYSVIIFFMKLRSSHVERKVIWWHFYLLRMSLAVFFLVSVVELDGLFVGWLYLVLVFQTKMMIQNSCHRREKATEAKRNKIQTHTGSQCVRERANVVNSTFLQFTLLKLPEF